MFIKRIKKETIIIESMESGYKHLRDFYDFLKEHNFDRDVYINYCKEYEFVCEFCKDSAEADENGFPNCCQKAQEEYINNNFDKIPAGQCHCVDCARDYFYGRELNKNCPYQILKIGVKSE